MFRPRRAHSALSLLCPNVACAPIAALYSGSGRAACRLRLFCFWLEGGGQNEIPQPTKVYSHWWHGCSHLRGDRGQSAKRLGWLAPAELVSAKLRPKPVVRKSPGDHSDSG